MSFLDKIPNRWLRHAILPATLTLLGFASKDYWARAVDWKHEVDTAVAAQPETTRKVQELSESVSDVKSSLKTLHDRQLDQYRDQLEFQRDLYKALGESQKAREADSKASNLK